MYTIQGMQAPATCLWSLQCGRRYFSYGCSGALGPQLPEWFGIAYGAGVIFCVTVVRCLRLNKASLPLCEMCLSVCLQLLPMHSVQAALVK